MTRKSCAVGMRNAILRKLNISEITDILTVGDMENMQLESRMWFRMNFAGGVFSRKTLVSI